MRKDKLREHILLILLASAVGTTTMLAPKQAHPVGGISNSKVIVPNTETVQKGRVEFEPFFGLSIADDRDDSTEFESGTRLTFGLLDNLEVGVNLIYLTISDSDKIESAEKEFGDTTAGFKIRLMDDDDNYPFSLAWQSGVTFPTSGDDAPWVYELGGLILTKNVNERLSIDGDFVVGIVEGGEEPDAFIFNSEIGLGYYITHRFQTVLEMAYSLENPENEDNTSAFILTAGFTVQAGKILTVIIGISQDIYTNNIDKQLTLTSAFTFLF